MRRLVGLALLLATLVARGAPAAANPPRPTARDVVAAVARAVVDDASRPAGERLVGDALGDACVRAAAIAARRERVAFFVGALHAIDGADALARFPALKAMLDGLETPEASTARRAALGKPTLRGRADLLLHVLAAGAVASISGEPAARAVSFGKETSDARPGGSGFSFADLLADEGGIGLAAALAGAAGAATWERLEASCQGADLVPDPAGEPEGLAADAFAKDFGGYGDPRFVAKCDALRARVTAGAFLTPPAARDASGLLADVLARHSVPGMAGAITWRGKTTAIGAAGVRAAGSKALATTADLWHLGSCTKSMTATLIGSAVESGRLSWDTKLPRGLSWLGPGKVAAGWKDVTLEMLLHHRGGAPAAFDPRGVMGAPFEAEGSRVVLLQTVLSAPPANPPGTTFLYSNAGYAIAGAVYEHDRGLAWEKAIAHDLWAPLGITTGGFGAPGTAGTLDQPRGHDAAGKAVEPGPGSDNPPAIGPAGTVHMSIGDWARYVALHVEGEGIAPRLLSPATFRRLHAPPPGGDYAMGWGVTDRPWGGRVLTHSGSNTMWYCVTWLSPSKEFGVVVACNRAGADAEKACDEAAWSLIEDHLAHEGASK